MLRHLLSRHAVRLGLVLALGALPAALAGCDDPAGSGPAVAAVDVTAPDTRVAVGQTLQLGIAVRDAGGAELTGSRVAWSSSNEGVATVSAAGLVTGRAPGSATITATSGGKQDQVEVAVDPAVARVTLEPDSFFLVVGNTVAVQPPSADNLANARARILAVPRDAAGGVMLGVPVRFSTSSAAVATVSDSGVVRGISPGTATITARAGGAEGRLTVTVERAWTLTYLGTLPGLPESRAMGINAQGQVTGWSSAANTTQDAPAGSRGWVWQNGALTELTVPGKTGLTVAPVAINDRGQVGGMVAATDGAFVALWENGVPTLAPSPGGQAYDLNERGEMVGGWRSSFCTRNCGGGWWIFRNGTVREPGNQGFLRILPEAINDAGQIAGTVFERQPGTESTRAFLLESDSAALTLLPTSAVASQAHDIDARGRVVGQDNVDGYRAFIWTRGGAPVHLGRLPGGFIAVATDVNSQGVAIGRSNCAGCTDALPVLFRGSAAVRIEDLFAAGDWVVREVTDINDRGQIVGWGTHRTTGVRGALLLTPPAP
jgi:uncharacterized membrane protein